jgi:tetratricopeptide (TPR) repeat protein
MRDKERDLASQRRKRIETATDLYKAGHAAEAAKQFLDCLGLFSEEERDTREYAVLCCNLGSALAESGELKTATKFFHAALAVHDKLGEEHDSALLHFNLGNVYNYSNNWQASVDHYRTALDIFNRLGDRWREAACLT